MGKRHAESQQREAYQDQQIDDLQSQPSAPAAPSGGMSADAVERLEQLGKLHEQGILTDEEFSAQKQKVLAG